MADSDPRVARVRSAFEATLTPNSAAGAWTPPLPEALASLFPGYEIETLLGRGGMGAVYRARQKSLDRLVAIKLLPFDLGVQEDFAERFRREATALAQLSHPHVVPVYDFGQADDGHFFMVMEYVAGSDLAVRLQRGPMPPAEAIAVVRQVCDALEFAHAHGVIHRDIKPSNILLDADGRVKVADFGIAQLAGTELRTTLTSPGMLLGTPEYVAPEQLRPDAVVDERADIFSVGVMLYEMLTGQLPRGVFRPLAELVPAARGLDRVITRALQSEPALRYPAVHDLRAALDEARLRPWSDRWRVAVPVLAVVMAAAAWQWRPGTPPAPAAAPFSNSLGQRFLPAGTPGVLFCTTEVRVRDFAVFVSARQLPVFPAPTWVNFLGTEEGWKTVQASWKSPGFPQTDDHPVVGITRDEATAFCEWLTKHEHTSGRIGADDFYRLPTNAEWSVAVGLEADTLFPSRSYPWGTEYPPRAGAGNYASEEIRDTGGNHARLIVLAGYRDGYAFTAPVGSFAADPRGLHDLGGNVWEWTDDRTGPRGTLRGGGWSDTQSDKLDAACRIPHDADLRCYTFGFRVVLVRKFAATPGKP